MSKVKITVLNKRGDVIDTFIRRDDIRPDDVIGWLQAPRFVLMDETRGFHGFTNDVVGNIKTEVLS